MKILLLVLGILSYGLIGLQAQVTVPNTFASGNPISASEMNANFTALANAFNALRSEVQSLFPKGSIVATFVPPDANDDYMAGSTDWALADGSIPSDVLATYTGLFPDLRGQFLRGTNLGRVDGFQDPDSASRNGGDAKKAGSFQDDGFQGHAHTVDTFYGTGYQASSTVTIGSNTSVGQLLARGIVTDGGHGEPRVSTETRPSNVAVYWYIKIR